MTSPDPSPAPARSNPRPGGLQRLIYASRQNLPDGAPLDEVVSDIIRASIRNNREQSITGLLLVHGGWFVQALEGPAAAVQERFERIAGDPRHADPKVLEIEPASGRAFGDWNMCARTLSDADEALLDELEQRQAFSPDRLDARSALRLLKAVRDIQGRAGFG
ncbi:BLUF domain-containing protein [Phenylobacterium sp.]|uniref:BLUF domain-containing protein n=1 Tax=Phenylobacterium sp. TaxID=1871053 RepID=UPI002730D9C4|nr:BLUF domain-containing protein [Phenylobacterium sp.]MDP1616173.1 BLUF domain-containing protein [Phenylobacterium sp.]MDP1988187.1 BLUF domain-containing protein [Phenylobacterium sp.]